MKFDLELDVREAAGAILAHSYRVGPGGATLKKGHLVTAPDVEALALAGNVTVAAVRIEPGDVSEDEAAARIAKAMAGPNVRIDRATTGRANLFATAHGVFLVSRERLDALNVIDEAITVATLPPDSAVDAETMIATVKIIPFAVAESLVASAESAARGDWLHLAPFSPKRAGLVLTTVNGTHDEVLARAAKSQALRMETLGGSIDRQVRVPHALGPVANAIEALIGEGLDIVMVLGASAIVDRRDVVPAAIESIGGVIDHFGMPVDPGNLLLLAHRGSTPIIGVPGCARSLKPSGFDWALERLVANVPIAPRDIMRLGAGGLLADVPRPLPRNATQVTRNATPP